MPLSKRQPPRVVIHKCFARMGFVRFLIVVFISTLSITSASFLRQQYDEISLFTEHRSLKSSKSSKAKSRSFNYSLVNWHDDSKGKSGDEFGEAVSIQNNVAIVASPVQSDFPLYEVSDGKVFIFVDSTGTNNWEMIREVTGEDASEFFGASLALHASNGNYFAVVGAPRGNRYGQYSGGAYYFNVETDASKDQEYPKHLVQTERHGNAHFGTSVAISEVNGQVRVAIGASGHRGKGAVFIYTRAIDGSLTDELILYGSIVKTGGQFGYSLAFNDNLVVVSAPIVQHGTVFVFTLTETGTFTQASYLSAPASSSAGDTNGDSVGSVYYYFGGSLAVGNSYLFVGSPLNNLRGLNSGSVYLYDITDTSAPKFVQTIFPAVHDASGLDFGWSMGYDVVNKKLIVGSCDKDSSSYTGGKAFVYTQKGEGYFLEALFHANKLVSGRTSKESAVSLFGKGVSIHGDYALVGAPFGNGEQYRSGDVYFYKAQTQEEFSSSNNDLDSSSAIDFSSTNVQVALIAAVCLLVLVLLYRRYTVHGEEEGFGNFLSTGCVTDEGGDDSSFVDEDSKHPMIVRSSKKSGSGKGSKKGGGKSSSSSASKKSSKGKSSRASVAYSSVRHEDL